MKRLGGLRARLRRVLGRDKRWVPGAMVEPSPPKPDERIGPPDFVGVGAMKAGTTWWYAMLLEHPRVRRPAGGQKELHYFNRMVERGAPLSDYHCFFPRREGQIVGEFTPNYLVEPWAAPLLARIAPEAKILVMLRDPVARMISGITHVASRADGVNVPKVRNQFVQSMYLHQLERLFAHFPREQVLVLQYEACQADPAPHFQRTLDFLGLESHEPTWERRVNVTRVEKVVLQPEILESLVPMLAEDARRLQDHVDLDLDLWPSVR